MTTNKMNLIFCGGGTGGHIFPAVALANQFKSEHPDCKIQFVGALGKMEMEKVLAAGFEIIGLPVEGLIRKLTLKNITVLLKAVYSLFKARRILRNFETTAVIGTGGFASLPVCYAASQMGIPVFVWEGNGFAGLTNQIMKKRARRIYCGFDGMEKQFPFGNWIHSGNPIRKELLKPSDKESAYSYFNFSQKKPTIFITGGSLGAQSINTAVENSFQQWLEDGYQVIWQTGKFYDKQHDITSLWQSAFLEDMRLAYSIADVVVSRSGALSVSEIMAMGVPAVFVPSPNVTDDHQTKNAQKALETGGAMILKDSELTEKLASTVKDLLNNPTKRDEMRLSLQKASRPEATETIVNDIIANL